MDQSEMNSCLAKINTMARDELLTFNEAACARIKYLNSQESLKAAATLKIGDKVSFYSKKYGTVSIKVESVSRGKVKGHDLGRFPYEWTVAASLCQKVA
jgi:hypothetical protein